jgi:UDP-MurNAc hydroxylase
MQVTLINHACVKLAIGDIAVLCDPWIDGPVFNFGWDLLIKTPMDIDAIMAGVTHIWISHEHPDHFSPKFLDQIAAQYVGRIPILFQKTRDKRVKTFCESRGFTVVELADRARRSFDGVAVMCGTSEFYDSWLYLSDGNSRVLNLNDCRVRDERELRKLAACIGPLDLLLTQFSYAAWKGGTANPHYRALAAQQKLDVVAAQTRILRPRHVVPFASLIYFSNEENAYLNDRVNRPDDAHAAIAAAGGRPVILFPGDRWSPDQPYDDTTARERYRAVYGGLASLPLRPPGDSVPLAELQREFAAYRAKIYAKNSRLLIGLLRRLPVLGAFRPVTIRLTDLDTLVSVSVVDGFAVVARGEPDVAMHSSSLAFVLRNEFGYDTLTVNGRFDATPAGFARMTKSLAIGSLNAMGLAVSPRLVLNLPIVLILLRLLVTVLRTMRGATNRGHAPSPQLSD